MLPQFWSLLAYALAGLAIVRLWRYRRNRPIVPLELGVLVLIALLVGPLSWEHYFVWAFIPFVLCFDVELWVGRPRGEVAVLLAALASGTYLLSIPVQSLWTMSEAAPWRAVLTSPATVAAMLYLAVVVRLLTRVRAREDDAVRDAEDRGQADPSRQRYSFV
jgi:hypothetical protein